MFPSIAALGVMEESGGKIKQLRGIEILSKASDDFEVQTQWSLCTSPKTKKVIQQGAAGDVFS